MARPRRPESADVELTATVRARELRFEEAPETRVEFTGEPGHESANGSDRANLPEHVEPWVTYRDVRVDYRLAARVLDPTDRSEPGSVDE
ncbi:MAG: hypothetical protein ACRDYU_09895 [Actinomycetes bacterium]